MKSKRRQPTLDVSPNTKSESGLVAQHRRHTTAMLQQLANITGIPTTDVSTGKTSTPTTKEKK